MPVCQSLGGVLRVLFMGFFVRTNFCSVCGPMVHTAIDGSGNTPVLRKVVGDARIGTQHPMRIAMMESL